jgi:hypothetical protein
VEQERAFVDCVVCDWRRYAQAVYRGVEVGPMGLAWEVDPRCHRCGALVAEPVVVEVDEEPSPEEITKLLRNFTAPLVDTGLLESAA